MTLTGFLLPGLTLFKSRKNAIEFRKRFFSKMDVWCIANFANLRHLLFKGAVNPAAAFFYKAAQKNADKPDSILTYAPLAMNQTSRYEQSSRGRKKLWTVFVNADEMREIPYGDVVSGMSFPWKMAMWGTMRDKYLLVSLEKAVVSLSAFAKANDLNVSQGLELRDKTASDKIEPLPEVAGKTRLDMAVLRGCGKIFSFPQKALKTIPSSRTYVRKGRGVNPLTTCRPPHVIVDANRKFSVFSDQFIVVPSRQIGIAGDQSKADLLKALALYLCSDFVQYQQRLSSSSWGIERGRLTQEDLLALPTPLDSLPPEEVLEWAKLHDELAQKSAENMLAQQFFKPAKDPISLQPLMDEVNEKVNALLGLSEEEQCFVRDFVTIRMKLNDGAIPLVAMEYASIAEINAYAEILKRALDDFLDFDINDQHRITARCSSSMVFLTIEHPETSPAGPVTVSEVADVELNEELQRVEKNLSLQQRQWIYFRKTLKQFDGRTTCFIKSRQRLGWLQSQAFTDADEFITEKLTRNGND